MEYYIEAIRAAAAASAPRDLKPALDFIVERAQEDYKAGALDVLELDDIGTEYVSALMDAGVAHYI